MQVIPVIDLIDGVVVHARRGDRAAYRPIETPLARTADPVDVTAGLLNLFPFPTLYVADLDAIRGRGANYAALAKLRAAYPELTLWIDSGAADRRAVETIRTFGAPVLGSESQTDVELLLSTPEALLSLDFRGDDFQGPPDLLSRVDLWPRRVIVMTLHRVGAGGGPDFERLAAVRALAGDRALYAAGGVRDAADLAALKAAGASGALVASALHDGRLRAQDLR